MNEPISHSGAPDRTPGQQQIQEFREGAQLFKEALEEFKKTDMGNLEKRQKFKSVMDQAMRVMSATAKEACLSKKASAAEKQLEEDFQQFHEHVERKDAPGIHLDYVKLQKDLERLEKEAQ
ncbi:MAG: hypothetical protein AAGI90_03830 [Chlamydiota bacterium]